MSTQTQTTTVSQLRKGAMSQNEIAQLPKAKQFPEMLESFKSEIARALPRHLNPDRMARIALTCFRMNPTLAECTPGSVFAAVVQASQLGLEPGLMGQAYLIPYNKKVKRNGRDEWIKECQLIPGYQGLLDLVRRTGLVVSIEAHVVYSRDHFDLSFGLTPVLEHKPVLDGDRGERRLAYAVAKLKDGGVHVEVMTRTEIESIRDRSQNVVNAKKYGKTTPWDTDTDQMWLKTVLRRISKFLPKSPELAVALELDRLASSGYAQGIELKDAIAGEYTPITHEEDGGEGDGAGGDTTGGGESGAEQGSTDQAPTPTPAPAAAPAESPTPSAQAPASAPAPSGRRRNSPPLDLE
jgi:recombination protein RecT